MRRIVFVLCLSTMKKVIMLMRVVLISLSLHAQSGFGLMGGVNVSSSSEPYMDWRFGGFVGGVYDMQVKNNIYLQSRLVLSYQENQREPEFISQFNICVPILASYRMSLSDRAGLLLNAGPYLQYSIFGRKDALFIDGRSLGWWHYDFSDKITYGAQVGVQYEYKNFFGTLDYKHSFRRSVLNMNGFENTIKLGVGYKF